MGRAQHFRQGKSSEKQSLGDAPRGGKGKGKTTRSQRTNKSYKQVLCGRPSVDDVERASRGDKTKAMGVVEREAPYRLTRDEREAWERAKKRGGHGHGNGVGGGGFIEVQTKCSSALAPHRYPYVNTHRLYCDAKSAPFVVVEQDQVAGADEILVDLSTLRLEVDAPCRRRLVELAEAAEAGVKVEDQCGGDEPLTVQIRYIVGLETDLGDLLPPSLRVTGDLAGAEAEADEPGSRADADVDVAADARAGADTGVGADMSADDGTEAAPTADELAAAEAAVTEAADVVRMLKDAGATNADDAVVAGVAELLSLKSSLAVMEATTAACAPAAMEAAEAAAEAEVERIEEDARRSLAELQIHYLPERYMRFKCPDRATAKTLAKAIAAEDLLAIAAEDVAIGAEDLLALVA